MGGFSFKIKGIDLSGRSRGFFYCSKNRKNLKTTMESGCGQLATTIKKNSPFGLLDPPLQSHTEVDMSGSVCIIISL